MAPHFFDFDGLIDGSWWLFILVTAVSTSYGENELFNKLQIPTITGYMIVGFLCGPFVLHVLTVDQVLECNYVNKIALSFIAFSAGAEIHYNEIKPLLKSIIYISAGMTFFTMVLCAPLSYAMGQSALISWIGMVIISM